MIFPAMFAIFTVSLLEVCANWDIGLILGMRRGCDGMIGSWCGRSGRSGRICFSRCGRIVSVSYGVNICGFYNILINFGF